MNQFLESHLTATRRHFFRQLGVGSAALTSMLNADAATAEVATRVQKT
jgi:hypothetical protein